MLASNNEASTIATRSSSGAPHTPSLPKKCRRRRRRQARRAANRNRASSSAAPVTPDERWANQGTGRSGATQPLLEGIDPTSRMRTAEYPHSQIVGKPLIAAANENSPFHLGLESGEFPGLYKPAVPDQRQDSTARTFRVNNSGSGISSPPYLQPYTKPFSGRPSRPVMTCPTREAGGALRQRSGIFYPLLPRAPTPRHQHCRRRRPSRASRCPTPGTTSYDCEDWEYQPATDTPFYEEMCFQEALQKAPL